MSNTASVTLRYTRPVGSITAYDNVWKPGGDPQTVPASVSEALLAQYGESLEVVETIEPEVKEPKKEVKEDPPVPSEPASDEEEVTEEVLEEDNEEDTKDVAEKQVPKGQKKSTKASTANKNKS